MITRGHLTLIVSNLPTAPTPLPPAQRRLDLAVIEAARVWAEEVHVLGLRPDGSAAGVAALNLLDAVHDLEYHEVNGAIDSAALYLPLADDPG